LCFSIPENIFVSGNAFVNYHTILIDHKTSILDVCIINIYISIGALRGNKTSSTIGTIVCIEPASKIYAQIYITNHYESKANATIGESF